MSVQRLRPESEWETCFPCGKKTEEEDLETCPYCTRDSCFRCVLEQLHAFTGSLEYKCKVSGKQIYTNLKFTKEERREDMRRRLMAGCGTCD